MAVGFIQRELGGRWSALGAERARYIAGCSPLLDEAANDPGLSAAAHEVMSVAHLLVLAGPPRSRMRLQHIWLALLLHSRFPGANTAHSVFRSVGVDAVDLLERWRRAPPRPKRKTPEPRVGLRRRLGSN